MHGVERHHIFHNHKETDTQNLLHVLDTVCDNILVYSIDREIGILGLPLDLKNKHVTVQFSARAGNDRYLMLNNLQSACDKDADLAQLINNVIDMCHKRHPVSLV